ncbi:hypothetical protein EVAR_26954_1 [Eumeta japonica]|uniref:Uncharacterized protein n=1 Tax=Eumeta variegata TaxID=151549 RepID=A0A4C1VJ84_EUMVA|nr:hypothetical protein EVAR_26954_1 [Eumeta japonica]
MRNLCHGLRIDPLRGERGPRNQSVPCCMQYNFSPRGSELFASSTYYLFKAGYTCERKPHRASKMPWERPANRSTVVSCSKELMLQV